LSPDITPDDDIEDNSVGMDDTLVMGRKHTVALQPASEIPDQTLDVDDMEDFRMGKKNTCKPMQHGIEDETELFGRGDSSSDDMNETLTRETNINIGLKTPSKP
jgi:hypothetical protein